MTLNNISIKHYYLQFNNNMSNVCERVIANGNMINLVEKTPICFYFGTKIEKKSIRNDLSRFFF